MRTKLLILGGVLAAGVVIHHSGHCPLMEAKKAFARHSVSAPARESPVGGQANEAVTGEALSAVAR